jgi:hypothetical protein
VVCTGVLSGAGRRGRALITAARGRRGSGPARLGRRGQPDGCVKAAPPPTLPPACWVLLWRCWVSPLCVVRAMAVTQQQLPQNPARHSCRGVVGVLARAECWAGRGAVGCGVVWQGWISGGTWKCCAARPPGSRPTEWAASRAPPPPTVRTGGSSRQSQQRCRLGRQATASCPGHSGGGHSPRARRPSGLRAS